MSTPPASMGPVASPASTPGRAGRTDSPDRIDRLVEEFGARVRAAHEGSLRDIDRTVLEPLRAGLDAAAAQHRELLGLLESAIRGPGDAGDSTPDGGTPAWQALSRYLEQSRSLVLDPVRTTLHQLDCGEAVQRALDFVTGQIDEAIETLPETLERTEPVGLYVPDPGDPLRWRIGKWLVRSSRAWGRWRRSVGARVRRLFRQPVPVPPAHRQVVPLRQLAAWHAHARMPRIRVRALEQIQSGLAATAADLERAFDDWTHTLMMLQRELDLPVFHLPLAVVEPAGGPEAGGTDSPERPRIDEVLACATALDNRLHDLGESIAADADWLSGHLEPAHAELRQDVAHIGSFMLAPGQRQPAAEPVRDARQFERRAALWTEWHRQTAARLDLDSRLIALRERVAGHAAAAVAAVESDASGPALRVIEDVTADLDAIRAEVRSGFERTDPDGPYAVLEADLRNAAARIVELLDHGFAGRLAALGPETATRAAAERMIDAIAAHIAALEPSFLIHRLPEPGPAADPSARRSEVRLREIAEQAFDLVHLERMRRAPDRLASALEAGRAAARDMNIVVRFNLNAAVEELHAGADGSESARLQAAEELALNGIDQTRAALGQHTAAITGEAGAFARTLHETLLNGWNPLHDRVRVEDRMQEQLLDLRYRVASALRTAATSVRRQAVAATAAATRLARAGGVRARGLVRLGQSAVEGEQVTEESRQRTIDALAAIDEVLARLPRVYRRLFAFEPLADDAMLVGRDADLDAMRVHFDHWRMGRTDAIVVSGFDGNGLTSFLNVLPAAVFAGADVRRLTFVERQADEARLAGSLARLLGTDDEPHSLDQLATHVLESPAPQRPLVAILENLEQTLIRRPAGSQLARRLLAFFSRTDFRVFWVAAVARQAWLYIEKVEPTAARLVRHHPLPAVTRDGIQEVILSRHLRSGIPLRFVPPEPVPPLLRRRLRRAGTEADRQNLLRQDYFDRLGRLCGGNLVLAILYWLRSASLDEQTRVFRIQPIEPLSFAHLDALTLDQSFTLKAILEHGTLTLQEHDDVFGLPREASRHIFESLGNLFLIEPADSDSRLANFSFTTLAEERPQRIRPLVVHPVISHLRSRNLIL